MELDARSSNFSAIHFNDKSESRDISKAPKLVETRNRDDTRNRNLCLSPEILSKNLVTSTTTFPTNLCENEILFHLQRKYGNLEQPISFLG